MVDLYVQYIFIQTYFYYFCTPNYLFNVILYEFEFKKIYFVCLQEILSNVNTSEICAPFYLNPKNNMDGTFRFTKPCSVKIVGSHSIGTSLMPLIKVDVSIIMGKVSITIISLFNLIIFNF